MGVGGFLGVDDVTGEVLSVAASRWPAWLAVEPDLAGPGGVPGLRRWLQSVEAGEADRVLWALARLGSRSGADDPVAASTLAWALLPGACVLARRLSSLSPLIDELVAAQLWVEIRTFPWERLHRVAANILANTRAAVMRECGVRSQVARTDRVWGATTVVDPQDLWDDEPAAGPVDSAAELASVLGWACESGHLTVADRDLLVALVAESGRTGSRAPRRSWEGLLGREASEVVAQVLGVSAITVRRRGRRVIASLQAVADVAAEQIAV